MRAKYELMKFTEEEVSYVRPDGFDQVSEVIGSGKDIIKWLLRNDESVRGYKLVKK